MINYDSILSAFDGKPTLLQWLKMVKKALDESILKNVNITQNGEKVVFTFNFEDGTSISTPEVTLPKGDKGNDGVGIVRIETSNTQVVGNETESIIRVELSDGSVKQFKTYAKNGKSITGIDTVNDEVVGDKTLTTLRANYSDNTSNEFVVTAKNGKDASGSNMYLHCVKLSNSNSTKSIWFNAYSKKANLTLEEALEQIPTLTNENVDLSDTKILVSYENKGISIGIFSAGKFLSGSSYMILAKGISYQNSSNNVQKESGTFTPTQIVDTLIGENL